MKTHERINYILIGTLWSLIIMLLLAFWLNTIYNFNIFSASHWQYVSNLQASNKSIATGFYVAFAAAITGCISGLYVLFRPKFRKLIIKHPENNHAPQNQSVPHEQNNNTVAPAVVQVPQPQPSQHSEQNTTPETQPQTTQTNGIPMQRPPKLHIQMQERATLARNATTARTTQNTKPQPEPKKTPQHTDELRDIFENAGYKVLSPQNIADTPLSLIALGTNETLWLGACEVTHEKMADAILALKKVFQDTLDDIEIDINAFILNPSDSDSVEAIADFDSISDLSEKINTIPNEPESQADIDSGNMDAFAGYIETVLSYLGDK